MLSTRLGRTRGKALQGNGRALSHTLLLCMCNSQPTCHVHSRATHSTSPTSPDYSRPLSPPTCRRVGGCERPSGGRGRRCLQAGPAQRRAPAPRTGRCGRSLRARRQAGLHGGRADRNASKCCTQLHEEGGCGADLAATKFDHPTTAQTQEMLGNPVAIKLAAQHSTAQHSTAQRSAAQRTRERELAGAAPASRPHADALNVLHFAAHGCPHQAGSRAGGGHALCGAQKGKIWKWFHRGSNVGQCPEGQSWPAKTVCPLSQHLGPPPPSQPAAHLRCGVLQSGGGPAQPQSAHHPPQLAPPGACPAALRAAPPPQLPLAGHQEASPAAALLNAAAPCRPPPSQQLPLRRPQLQPWGQC